MRRHLVRVMLLAFLGSLLGCTSLVRERRIELLPPGLLEPQPHGPSPLTHLPAFPH